jgi:hypothetical protein
MSGASKKARSAVKVDGAHRRYLLVLIEPECNRTIRQNAMLSTHRVCAAAAANHESCRDQDQELLVAVIGDFQAKGGTRWMQAAEAVHVVGEHHKEQLEKGAHEADGTISTMEGKSTDALPSATAQKMLDLLKNVERHRLLDVVWFVGGRMAELESATGFEMYRALSAAHEVHGARMRIVFEEDTEVCKQVKDWCMLLDSEAVSICEADMQPLDSCTNPHTTPTDTASILSPSSSDRIQVCGGFSLEMEERIFCSNVHLRAEMQIPYMSNNGPSVSSFSVRMVACEHRLVTSRLHQSCPL